MASVSKRISDIPLSAVANISLQAAKQNWDDKISMAGGEPNFLPPHSVNKAFLEIVDKGYNKYSPFSGYSTLLELIKNKLQIVNNIFISMEQIYAVPGGSSAIITALMAVVDFGDEVIIQDPCWEHYAHVVRLAGGIPKAFNMVVEDNHYRPDIDHLKHLIGPRTKALLINTPLNPCGSVLTHNEICEIVDVVESYGIHLICDEEYESYVYTPSKHISPGSIYNKTITLHSFSKSFALTGLRLGYITAPLEVMNAILKVSLYSFMFAPSPSQHVAEVLLSEDYVSFANQACSLFERKANYLYESLNIIPGVNCNRPEGGLYVFPDFKMLGLTGEEITNGLFLEKHLLTVPGEVAGKNGAGHVRLYVGLEQDQLQEAISRINDFVKNLF